MKKRLISLIVAIVMILGMVPAPAFATGDYPFTAMVNGAEISEITQDTLTWTDWSGAISEITRYKVAVPADAKEVTLAFNEAKDWHYYDSQGNYLANGSTAAETEYTVVIQDSNSDGELDGISVQVAGEWTTEYYIQFIIAGQAGSCEHKYEEEITTPASCESAGVKTFTCSACGDTYTEEISAIGHSYGDGVITTDPGCETTGVKTFTCGTCGGTTTESVKATGHSYDDGVVTTDPSCTEDGVKTFTCATCGGTKTEAVDATGHSFADKVCTVCGAIDYTPEQDEDGVYQISNVNELLWFAETVNKGQTSISGVLTADIDLTGKDWPGIGINGTPFTGNFDGQNNTVTLAGSTFGLFGYTKGTSSSYVQIKNVITEGTAKNAAVVHDVIYTNVENCFNYADITGDSFIAGIVGSVNNNGMGSSGVTITNCGNEGTISGNKKVGGILGYAQVNAQISGCYNSGAVSGKEDVGGIAGYIQEWKGTSYVNNCYNRGTVTGNFTMAGIVGNLYNGVSVENCYNTGAADYAIAGNVYNNTASVSNTYYLVTASFDAVPYEDLFETIVATSKTKGEMSTSEMAMLLGNSYQTSCPAPVFTWQTAADHTGMADNVCDLCGTTVKTTYKVSIPSGTGYIVTGESTATEGESYSFTVTTSEGYCKGTNFAVRVGSTVLEEADGKYTYENVSGPLKITVTGVEKLPDTLTMTLPKTGNGYVVTPAEGYETTVARTEDFKFQVEIVPNFQKGENFAVKANDTVLTADENGVYTIENVTVNQTITVENVDIIPHNNPVTVNVTLTYGRNQFYDKTANSEFLLMEDITVPYFDLKLYGLECYYYNPDCYQYISGGDDDLTGNRATQTAGTREDAYGVITTMHVFIYITEVYYCGIDPEDAGKGYLYEEGLIGAEIAGDYETSNKALYYTGGVGSSFMYLWGHGSNLNYYLDYEYPLGNVGWGSTADQQALKNGMVISAHLIENNQVSGSAYRFFTYGEGSTIKEQNKDAAALTAGESITLTLYESYDAGNYATGYNTLANEEILFWTDEPTSDIRDWYTSDYPFNTTTTEEGVPITDENGQITIDTTGMEPGVYYIAVDGAVSGDKESGAGVFILTVNAGEGSETPENPIPGDFDEDGIVEMTEVARILRAYNNTEELTADEMADLDTNEDGLLSLAEVAVVLRSYQS